MGKSFVERAAITPAYDHYQRRYATDPRESDKVLMALVEEVIAGRDKLTLLDIGCSTGNFLSHLAKRFPQLRLVGGDVASASLDIARRDLPSVEFRDMNMLEMGSSGEFDVIVANAVTYPFTDDEYATALGNVAHALKLGGIYLAFERVHDFGGQHLTIRETTPAHPEGVMLYARPAGFVRDLALRSGLTEVEFRPFSIPIDLVPHTRSDGVIATHTVKLDNGERLSMRGAIYQPWCFLRAAKAHIAGAMRTA